MSESMFCPRVRSNIYKAAALYCHVQWTEKKTMAGGCIVLSSFLPDNGIYSLHTHFPEFLLFRPDDLFNGFWFKTPEERITALLFAAAIAYDSDELYNPFEI